MNIFKINIVDNGSSREDQIHNVIAGYMEDGRLIEIADRVGLDDLHKALGELAISDGWYERDYISGVLIFEDGMGSFIDGYYFSRDGRLVNMERIATSPNFYTAVELNELYRKIDPFNDENTVKGCLELIDTDPIYVINQLMEELKEV